MGIDALVERMRDALAAMEQDGDARRFFLATYLRTTVAVRDELAAGHFADPGWVEHWDVVFAELYLDAVAHADHGGPVPLPWAVAFAATDQPPLRHVLLGMNAHINYDLPQALVAVIPPDEFADAERSAARKADHRRLDLVLAGRVRAEDRELARLGGATLTDRLLRPLNQSGTKRFLREARDKVWDNARALDQARTEGPDVLAGRLDQLEVLSARRVQQLCAPGQVLLKLAVRGFGVRLPAPGAAL